MSKLRAYGAAISEMSNFLLSVFPMPSKTENARCEWIKSRVLVSF